jgi:hypothetical protein
MLLGGFGPRRKPRWDEAPAPFYELLEGGDALAGRGLTQITPK